MKAITGTTLAAILVALAATMPVQAMTANEQPLSFKACGEKYRAAKADGSLGAAKWMEFRQSVCGIASPAASARQTTVTRSEAASSEMLRRVAFPERVAEEFADRTPAQQRMQTCLVQYRANKQAGTLAGLRWVQKGGGYYSLCNARLKRTDI